jgi:hypothetical protein
VGAKINKYLNVPTLVAKQVYERLRLAIDGESTLEEAHSVNVRFLQKDGLRQFGLWFPHGIDIIFGLLDSLCRERANCHQSNHVLFSFEKDPAYFLAF